MPIHTAAKGVYLVNSECIYLVACKNPCTNFIQVKRQVNGTTEGNAEVDYVNIFYVSGKPLASSRREFLEDTQTAEVPSNGYCNTASQYAIITPCAGDSGRF